MLVIFLVTLLLTVASSLLIVEALWRLRGTDKPSRRGLPGRTVGLPDGFLWTREARPDFTFEAAQASKRQP